MDSKVTVTETFLEMHFYKVKINGKMGNSTHCKIVPLKISS